MTNRRPFLPVLTILLFVVAATVSRAENWPNWRGPHEDGLSDEKNLPIEWSPESGIRWKTPIEGKGHSSPIVWNDAIFLTSAVKESDSRLLWKLDRSTGSVVWKKEVLTAPLEPIHPLNSYASSTPATDGERVYVSFLDRSEMYVAAFDFNGDRVWETRPGPFSSKHGFCSSPVVYNEWLVVNGDHDGESYLCTLDRRTGKVVWKVPRAGKTRSYSVPRVMTIDGKDQIILTGSHATSGFDSDTGKLIWTVDGPSEQMVASILHKDDLIFAMGGFPERHLLAIKKGGIGQITSSHVVWRSHRAVPYVPSAILYGDYLHVVSDDGMYTCYEPASGKLLQQKRVGTHVSASIVGGDNHVFITDDEGRTTVLKNNAKFEIVAKNGIGEGVFTSPAISHQTIFIRGEKHLFAIGR
ncbi:PQQ-like beta-propeller repeat protein [bacterium]|nr:PQQ-like beta-propeller repeat protein [bacterium]